MPASDLFDGLNAPVWLTAAAIVAVFVAVFWLLYAAHSSLLQKRSIAAARSRRLKRTITDDDIRRALEDPKVRAIVEDKQRRIDEITAEQKEREAVIAEQHTAPGRGSPRERQPGHRPSPRGAARQVVGVHPRPHRRRPDGRASGQRTALGTRRRRRRRGRAVRPGRRPRGRLGHHVVRVGRRKRGRARWATAAPVAQDDTPCAEERDPRCPSRSCPRTRRGSRRSGRSSTRTTPYRPTSTGSPTRTCTGPTRCSVTP